MATANTTRGSGAIAPRKPFAVWVVAGGLVFTGIATLVLASLGYVANGNIGQFLGNLIFVVPLLAPALFVWRERRWAYLTSAVISLVLLVLFLLFAASSLTNPADSAFAALAAILPALLLIATFGILSYRHATTGIREKRYLASAQSSGGLLTLAVVGFVVGMVVAGSIGAGVILRNTAGRPADIRIVANAATAAVPYVPAVFTVSAGGTVTWINLETTAHTVTSNTTGQFDSGPITTGQSWSHTFTQAGTYHYYCSIHPMMTGTVVVT